MEDINLHFTGDLHAIAAANNTLAAMIDNHIHQGNQLRIDPRRVTWRRCLDVNDRSLRGIVTGLGGPGQGVPRESGFDITAASEIMAILCLATDLADLKARLSRIVVGQTFDQEPVTAEQLGAAGALTALLRDAINPNLVQTLGGTPAIVHGGPFANIAHGCNSLIATDTALRYADVVLTEAGFGSDLGAEKFFDIKARAGDLDVASVVVVATVRALKYNGGFENLERHVANVRKFGARPVVALNHFITDTEDEVNEVIEWGRRHDVAVVLTTVWADGGEGATELARVVLDEGVDKPAHTQPLYDPADGVLSSIETIAREIYGADAVQLSVNAQKDLKYLQQQGWDTLPVCISKTQYSFSDDPTALGAPTGHTLHVRKFIPRIGAGFIVALTGDVMTMPGLPKFPAAEGIDVTPSGEITGLF
ncbi:formate--tetrahydrofolate ligase [Corynebacterium hindlerae]|uniref:formate--tetrahydrofolate ligase n=1 Tax=Corynebacterium hindlerae TaxID=699041 RepID=A0A7G5FFB1_9CORY|nr:formate--tetrahydrofolate ligase [Corynebacterium hindlerae]